MIAIDAIPWGCTDAGVDEAGRGPIAGPVYAAAVILDPMRTMPGLTDSKLLTAVRREQLELEIQTCALAWAVARAEVEEIDTVNILQATLLAMRRAVQRLAPVPAAVLVDGTHCPPVGLPCRAVVQGDRCLPPVSAASILAKVARDREMLVLDERYPQYGFKFHKGYPTKAHLAALRLHGVSPVHRQTFRPVRAALGT